MNVVEAFRAVRRVFLDTAPVIYYVESHPKYSGLVEHVFERLDAGTLEAITSPITLAECLVIPFRDGDTGLQRAFLQVVAHGLNTSLSATDEGTGLLAAELRARYGLSLSDALQLATAIMTHCDALLTNDHSLKRVAEINVVVLNELTLAS